MQFHPLVLSLTAALAACATHAPAELVSARNAYDNATSNTLVKELVPAELHEAKMALDLAEKAFEDKPRHYRTADLAYVAERKAETAVAKATIAQAQGDTKKAATDLNIAQAQVMEDTKASLDASRDSLALSQQSLGAEKQARLDADKRTQAALAALALGAVKEEERGLVVTLSGSVLFRSDESTLLPEAQTRLDQVGAALMETKGRSLVIEGHTDSQGANSYNKDLSQRRAEAVKAYLVSKGYDSGTIKAEGIGEERPLADNTTNEGRSNNRRVEIVVQPAE